MMSDNVFKFFLERATVEEIERFCSSTGYCLIIFDNQHMTLKKENY